MEPVDEERKIAVAAALKRYLRNSSEFEEARSLKLPRSKHDFPKLLLLDTLHWVELARSELGKSTAAGIGEALMAIRRATAAGKLVVPCTEWTINEIARRGALESRKSAASFVVELSANRFARSAQDMMMCETVDAIQTDYFKRPALFEGRREMLVHWGLDDRPIVKTGNAAIDRLLTLVCRYPECTVHFMVHGMDRVGLAQARHDSERLIELARRVRALDANLTPSERRSAELGNSGRQHVAKVAAAMGMDSAQCAQLHSWLADSSNRDAFWARVPSFEVRLALFIERDKNKDASTEQNDVADSALLELGLPYANIVATERLWHNIATRARLQEKHQCRVIAGLRSLPDELERIGCLAKA